MSNAPTIYVIQAIRSAEQFVQGDWKARGPAEPKISPAAAELGQAAQRLNELFLAIQNEGAIRAIDAGQRVDQWRNHIGPVLRLAYDAAGGPA